jgi:predicted metal-dependent hydrolase
MTVMVSVGIASAAFQIAVYAVHNRRVNDKGREGSGLRAQRYVI